MASCEVSGEGAHAGGSLGREACQLYERGCARFRETRGAPALLFAPSLSMLLQDTARILSRRRKDQFLDYVYEDARIQEALAHESRKLAVQARDFQRRAREAATNGSSEALRRLHRVEARFYKLEDAYYKRARDLSLERDSLKSLYGVKPRVYGHWRAEAPETLPPSVPTGVIAKRLNEWQQGKQRATAARMALHATVQEEQAGS